MQSSDVAEEMIQDAINAGNYPLASQRLIAYSDGTLSRGQINRLQCAIMNARSAVSADADGPGAA